MGRPESFPVVFARHSSLERAREEEVRSPRTEVINSSDDLRRWANETGFPAVLKADGTSGGNGVRIVRTFEEAERAFRLLSAPPAWARAVKRTAFDTDSTLLWPSLRSSAIGRERPGVCEGARSHERGRLLEGRRSGQPTF